MKTLMPYRGPSYSALRYAAMRKKNSFTVSDVMALIGHRFKQPYMAGRSLERLTNLGFLKYSQGSWTITSAGYDYLRVTVQPSEVLRNE